MEGRAGQSRAGQERAGQGREKAILVRFIISISQNGDRLGCINGIATI